MEYSRILTKEERKLVEFLLKKSSINFGDNWCDNLFVSPMDDGGMGSLLLLPNGVQINNNRKFGKKISEIQFYDEDGVEVIASLNVDQNGDLFELEIWKTDFSKLINLPDTFDK